jgi:thioredoxin-like negative regulator of GroEL
MTITITDTELSRLVDVGFAATHLGEISQARALFENLLQYKEHAPARIGLALTYLAAGDFARSETILRDEVLAVNPADADALTLLGLSLSFAGRTEEAAELFERVPQTSAGGKLVAALSALS